jgi:hypothetical protein
VRRQIAHKSEGGNGTRLKTVIGLDDLVRIALTNNLDITAIDMLLEAHVTCSRLLAAVRSPKIGMDGCSMRKLIG